MKPRHRRFLLIAAAVAVLAVTAAFVLNAFQSNLVFFFSPTQIAQGEAPKGLLLSRFRAAGDAVTALRNAAEVMEMVEDRDIQAVLFLGAMLADVPHTRPIGVMATSQNEHARSELEIEMSQYEGPVGILSVLGIELEKAGIPADFLCSFQ